MRAVDVYGFAGGFTLGMVQAGFELIAKKENAQGFGAANCEANRTLLGNNWKTQKSPATQWEVMPDAQVVFGNPPCSRPDSRACQQSIFAERILPLTIVCGTLQTS